MGGILAQAADDAGAVVAHYRQRQAADRADHGQRRGAAGAGAADRGGAGALVAPGQVVPMDSIIAWLEHKRLQPLLHGARARRICRARRHPRSFPAGLDQPVRFDFFGDSLESIRTFDAETQRTLLDMRALDLVPISEFQLVTETIRRFRMGYVAEFGAVGRDDPLYEAVSEGRRHPGMEHWLPLFQERMDTLFDYFGDAAIAIEPQGEDAVRERFKQIKELLRGTARGTGSIRAAVSSISLCRPTGSI